MVLQVLDTNQRRVRWAAAADGSASGGLGSGDRPRWTVSSALVALGAVIFGSLLIGSAIFALFVAGGVDSDTVSDSAGFTLTATFAQELLFVGAAIFTAAQFARPTPAQFGFRSFPLSALGWTAGAFAAYLGASAIYGSLIDIPTEDLPFANDPSTLLAVVIGIFVIGIAPPVEEFFFRGFLYQALRGRFGVVLGAVASGLIFGVIHLEAVEQMGILAILGVILALLFERTGTLWPCIFVHTVNNAFAFQYVMTH